MPKTDKTEPPQPDPPPPRSLKLEVTDSERACFSRDWAISRELETGLIDLLRERKPRTVLELGAGLSTIILLRYATQTGARTIHLDQPGSAYANMLGCLRLAGLPLDSVRAAPIAADFYCDSETRDCNEPFDLVIVDGPRGSRGRSSAAGVQFLARVIGRNSIVVIDDTNRPAEARLAAQVANWFGPDSFNRRDVTDSVYTHRRSTLLFPRPERT